MGQIVASLLVMVLVMPLSTAAQSARGTAAPMTVHACSFLTKELVAEYTPLSKQAFALVSGLAPSEDAIGQSGSECTYGGVTFNIDAINPEYFEKTRKAEWKAITGVGDTAYFRDNAGRFAELYVRTGSHSFTIQMDVPTGRTSVAIQPNVIALAKAILPKVK
jgi:hypothetical protein